MSQLNSIYTTQRYGVGIAFQRSHQNLKRSSKPRLTKASNIYLHKAISRKVGMDQLRSGTYQE